MKLQNAIADYRAKFKENVPENIQLIMSQATQALNESGMTSRAPKQGEVLPEFELSNQLGQLRSLNQLLEQGPLVMTFYRGGWCPYCNLELKAYQAVLPELKKAGANLVAITPELPDQSLSTAEKNALEFEVLSDPGSNYAKRLGLVFSLPEELRTIYSGFGIDVEGHNGKGQFDLPLAATFVVTPDKAIVSAFVDADYTKRQEPSEIIALLDKL
ncbi:peroxiredoxin-like family protein [Agarivorans sp. QJM3NY_25]|uniref:peroxiredoxin-like family protein n=1 Tax=Agarivorans sp. QJM3NY_25 TaxID=3421430 RepID=UPI003D7DCE4F